MLIFNGLSLSGKRDSNPRPSAWEADALPTELLPQSLPVWESRRFYGANLRLFSDLSKFFAEIHQKFIRISVPDTHYLIWFINFKGLQRRGGLCTGAFGGRGRHRISFQECSPSGVRLQVAEEARQESYRESDGSGYGADDAPCLGVVCGFVCFVVPALVPVFVYVG